MRSTDDTYDGIPYEELPIETVEWTEERAEYIRTRSIRKHPNEFDVEPEWATEAVMDSGRLVASGQSEKGTTIEVIGYSPGAGRLLTVLLIGKEEPVQGEWWGINAWAASRQDSRDYQDASGRGTE